MRGGDEEKGLAGVINRTFDRIKLSYGRTLQATFSARGAIYAAWIVISLLAVVMFMQSPKELAPAEDQGVIFGVVNTPSNSTLEQVTQSTRAINKELLTIPETQLHLPDHLPQRRVLGRRPQALGPAQALGGADPRARCRAR